MGICDSLGFTFVMGAIMLAMGFCVFMVGYSFRHDEVSGLEKEIESLKKEKDKEIMRLLKIIDRHFKEKKT